MWSVARKFETPEPPVAAEREFVSRGCRERGGRRHRGQTLRGRPLGSLDFGVEEPLNNCKWKEACCGGKTGSFGWSR